MSEQTKPSMWQEWLNRKETLLKESGDCDGCKCGCDECKSGRCNECSCKDCSCEGCSC